jgi:hypothetical protein
MNVRATQEITPEKRIAAAARTCVEKMSKPVPFLPDYADFEAYLGPYIRKELALRERELMKKLTGENAQRKARELYFIEVGVDIENDILKYEGEIERVEAAGR